MINEKWIVEVKSRSGEWAGETIGIDWFPAFVGALNETETMTPEQASTFSNRTQASHAMWLALKYLADEYAYTAGYMMRCRKVYKGVAKTITLGDVRSVVQDSDIVVVVDDEGRGDA